MDIPFDQPNSLAKYEIDFFPHQGETGDGVVLAANREGLLALADTLRQLAETGPENHLHLGYNELEPQGPGFRIIFNSSGRISRDAA